MQDNLEWRVEGFYNRLGSKPNSYAVVATGESARSALRDEVWAVGAGFAYTTRPRARISPYLIAGAGVYHTRLGTNQHVEEPRVTETRQATGLGVNGGVGVRWRAGERTTFQLEARLHRALYDGRGSSFIPVTLGFTF